MENYKTIRSLEINEAFGNAVNNIVNFKGRARRSEFWWVMLFVCIAYVVPFTWPVAWVLSFLSIPLTFRRLHDAGYSGWWWGIGIILNLVCLGLVIWGVVKLVLVSPELDTMDTSEIIYSLFSVILSYMAIIGINMLYKILLIFFLCSDSKAETNKYGPSPKYVPVHPEEAASDGQTASYDQQERSETDVL